MSHGINDYILNIFQVHRREAEGREGTVIERNSKPKARVTENKWLENLPSRLAD